MSAKLNRHPIAWGAGALSLIVGSVALTAGWTFLPSLAAAAKDGKAVPWFVTWGFVVITAGVALVLVGVIITESE